MFQLPEGHPSHFTNLTESSNLSEADFYGFSIKLASFLSLNEIPRSLRRFQHSWFWWKPEHDKSLSNYLTIGADNGILVQDKEYSTYLRSLGIGAFAVGIPFLAYRTSISSVQAEQKFNALFIPMHSIPGADYSIEILHEIELFAKTKEDFSVLLSANDLSLANDVKRFTSRIFIGAASKEIYSFERLEHAFLSHQFVFSAHMGAHMLYAAACGCTVGLTDLPSIENKFDLDRVATGRYGDWFKSPVYSRDYLQMRIPNVFVRESNPTASFNNFPSIANSEPSLIALALGWPI